MVQIEEDERNCEQGEIVRQRKDLLKVESRPGSRDPTGVSRILRDGRFAGLSNPFSGVPPTFFPRKTEETREVEEEV